MRYSSEQEEAVEIVNDGFLKIFKSLHLFVPRHEDVEGALLGWMKTIIIHTAIDRYRKNKYAHLIGELDDGYHQISDTAQDAIDKIDYKEIMALVQKLSPTYRTVFNLYVIDGYKHEEIAQQLNISVGTSKSNLAKARMNVQKMLSEINIKFYERRAI
jgi:RNA polymerase sigma factor (sigma-70 family)